MPRRSLADMGFADRTVNLTTIATKLGISVSTVSRALRNVPGIHAATRSKVLELAAELGYLPPSKEASSGKTTRTILSLSQGRGVSGDAEYLAGMSRAALALNLTVVSHHYEPEDCANVLHARTQPPALRDRQVEGVLLMHRWPDEVVRELASRLPVVSIIHAYPSQSVDVIALDDREGMLEIVRHLHDRGHRRIGFFGYCAAMSWSRARFAAYVEALVGCGNTFRQEDVVVVPLNEAMAETPLPPADTTAQALAASRNQGVTAWVCPSEGLGNNLIVAINAAGLRVPKDLAVTGFHTGGGSHYGLPKLTTTRSDSQELGATALRRLLTRIDHPGEARRSILLPSEFLQGATT